jgi:hypothetical protein
MTSELHAWLGGTHSFVGTMHDQTTEEECIEADESWLESIKADLVRKNPDLADVLVVEMDGNETCLRHRGKKWLSFFRDGRES